MAKNYDLRREVKSNATITADGLAQETTLQGVLDAINNEEVTSADVLLYNKRIENLLVSLLEEQMKTNKLLYKIYNPE